jgi:hypothetical protein
MARAVVTTQAVEFVAAQAAGSSMARLPAGQAIVPEQMELRPPDGGRWRAVSAERDPSTPGRLLILWEALE